MFIDKIIEELKRSKGIEADGAPILIEEREQKHVTYRFEIQHELWNGEPALRFMISTFSGSGSTGRNRKAFSWPTDDPEQLLQHIADTVMAALEPNAEKCDPRGWFGRTFDNLTGARYLNHIPCIAEHTYEDRRIWLAAKIMEDNQQGQLVTLYHEREKKSPMWMCLPVETFRTLQKMFRPEA